MQSIRTLVIGTFVVLLLPALASSGVAAGNRLVNGDFETGDLTGWEFAPWDEAGWNPVNPAGDVFPLLGTDNSHGYTVLDQTTLTQTVVAVDGETLTLSFDANVLPVITEVNQLGLIASRCESADPATRGLVSGRVVLEFLNASLIPGEEPYFKTLNGGATVEIDASGSFFTTAVAPLGTDYARVKVSGCAALSGIVFDNFVLDGF